MFEVGVLPHSLVEDVHAAVAVVERDPLAGVATFHAQWLDPRSLPDHPFNFFRNGTDLSVVTSRHDDQGLKSIHELRHGEDHGVHADLLFGAVEGRIEEGGGEIVKGPRRSTLRAQVIAQCATPTASRAAAKGTIRAAIPTIIQWRRVRRTS